MFLNVVTEINRLFDKHLYVVKINKQVRIAVHAVKISIEVRIAALVSHEFKFVIIQLEFCEQLNQQIFLVLSYPLTRSTVAIILPFCF